MATAKAPAAGTASALPTPPAAPGVRVGIPGRDGCLAAAGLVLGAVAWALGGRQGGESAAAFAAVALMAVGPVAFGALMQALDVLLPARPCGAAAAGPTGGTAAAAKASGNAESPSAAAGGTAAPKKSRSGREAAPGSGATGGDAAESPAGGLCSLLHARGILPDPMRWKPFPWSWLPDPIALLWGLLEILFIAPIAAVCIAVTVPTMVVLKAAWRHPRCSFVRRTLPELVRCFSRPLGRAVMRDPRDHSYLPWMLLLGLFTPALFLWALRRHAAHGLELSTLAAYHILRLGPRFQLFAHAHTIVHKAGHDHKGFFRGPFRCLNHVVEWWITPFYGVVPDNYSVAHMKIHHRWHNDVDDVHTNLDLDRTLLSSFLIYTPRFTLYWTGVSPAALLAKRGEWALLRQLLRGMAAYYGLTALLWCWNPIFCLVYWIYPHMEACVLLCAISYLWHAFVEESDPGNQYVNSVTVLDGHDNVWNEDYHVVHHHAPNVHWTDAPAHFERNLERYASVTATIFKDTEEGMLLKWLFERNFDAMAEHFVDLRGKLTHEEKKALIVRRLRVVIGREGRDGKRCQREWAATDTIRDFEAER